MYKCEHFKIQELVSRDYFNANGRYKNPDKLWLLFDERALKTIDLIRERYGKTFINTWDFGGKLNYCGYRDPYCNIGAELSQHKFGRAFDVHLESEELHDDLKRCIVAGHFQYVRGLEINTKGWVHIDIRNANDLVVFNG